MTEAERRALDTLIADLREEATEVARVHNVSTEKAETLAEVANRLERTFEREEKIGHVGDVAADTPAA